MLQYRCGRQRTRERTMTNYVVGQVLSFEYNGILRVGTVEAVKKTGVVLKLDYDKDGKTFKQFNFAKMMNVN
jgi:hypothetical protein